MTNLQNDKAEDLKIIKKKKGAFPFAIVVSIVAVFLAVLFVNATTPNNEKMELLANRTTDEDIKNEVEIIYHSENSKTIGMDSVDDETIAQLEKVPDSSITYVAVGGYGNPTGMGVHFQEYAVGVRANPIDGYRYVGCDSETIEFYEYVYNESLDQEVPWFLVPESGKHYIYLYYEPIE